MKKAHLSLPGFILAFTACNGPVVSIPGSSPGTPPSQGLPRDETIQGLEVQATINANLGILTLLTEDLKAPAGYGVVNNGRAYLQLKSTLSAELMTGKLQEELQQQLQQTCPAGQITRNTLQYTGEFQAAKIRPFGEDGPIGRKSTVKPEKCSLKARIFYSKSSSSSKAIKGRN